MYCTFKLPFSFPFSFFHDKALQTKLVCCLWLYSYCVWMSQSKTYQFRKLYISLLRSIWQWCWKEDDVIDDHAEHGGLLSGWWCPDGDWRAANTLKGIQCTPAHLTPRTMASICLGRIKLWQLGRVGNYCGGDIISDLPHSLNHSDNCHSQ